MVYRVAFAPEADAQLAAILRYVAERAGADTALAFTTAIVEYCEGFAHLPERGTRRDDLRPGLRIVGFRRQVAIAFEVDADTVLILGVFYGGQDWESVLRDPTG